MRLKTQKKFLILLIILLVICLCFMLSLAIHQAAITCQKNQRVDLVRNLVPADFALQLMFSHNEGVSQSAKGNGLIIYKTDSSGQLIQGITVKHREYIHSYQRTQHSL